MRNYMIALKLFPAILFSVALLACDNSDSSPQTKEPPGDTNDEICDNGATDYPTCTSFASCGDTAHNESEQRIRYQLATVDFGEACTSEVQTRLCSNGTFSDWSGSFAFELCTILPNPDEDFDGILNDIDNCATVPNANQSDINNDGIGDVCDPYYHAQLSVILDD